MFWIEVFEVVVYSFLVVLNEVLFEFESFIDVLYINWYIVSVFKGCVVFWVVG